MSGFNYVGGDGFDQFLLHNENNTGPWNYTRTSSYLQAVRADGGYFDAVEQIAMSHGGRPHWGKLHSRAADYLRSVYPRFDDFRAVRDRVDPDRLFGNAYLERVLGS